MWKIKNMYKEQLIIVSCAGCGRTQTLRKSKIIPCDGYICSLRGCKLNPDFKLPERPTGYICHCIINAAGGFNGWKICKATKDEMQSIERAKAIRDEGMRQLANKRLERLLDF
jgi:hypothetical protein